jgi:hypothetical protein
LGMNGFLSTRRTMSGAQLELTDPTPKILRYFHGMKSVPMEEKVFSPPAECFRTKSKNGKPVDHVLLNTNICFCG